MSRALPLSATPLPAGAATLPSGAADAADAAMQAAASAAPAAPTGGNLNDTVVLTGFWSSSAALRRGLDVQDVDPTGLPADWRERFFGRG